MTIHISHPSGVHVRVVLSDTEAVEWMGPAPAVGDTIRARLEAVGQLGRDVVGMVAFRAWRFEQRANGSTSLVLELHLDAEAVEMEGPAAVVGGGGA